MPNTTASPARRRLAPSGTAAGQAAAFRNRRVGAPAGDPPGISSLWLGVFSWYARRFIRRHFHTVRVAGSTRLTAAGPLIVYANHAGWWDPMMLMLLARQLTPGRAAYAPMDAKAIERYAMFKRMGFFGVEQHSPRGAVHFLQTSEAVLAQADTALWLTPQGRFADARERPVTFQRGLGLLARRLNGVQCVPLALEYSFWEERLPEVLIRVGDPVQVTTGREHTTEAWTHLFEARLQAVQDHLAADVVHRRADEFRILLRGRCGVNPVYDLWRRFKARLLGREFQSDHGEL